MAGSSLDSIDWNAVRKAANDCLNAAWSLICFADWSLDTEYDVNRAAAHLEAIAEARSTFRPAMEVLQPGLDCASDDSMRRSPVFDAIALATAGQSHRPDYRYGPVFCATAHEAAFELLRSTLLWYENGLNADLDERGLPDHCVAGIDDLHELAPVELRDTLVRLETRTPLRTLLGGKDCRQIRAWIDREWAAVSNIAGKPGTDRNDAQGPSRSDTNGELTARFERVLNALRSVIETETVWEERKNVMVPVADALISRDQARVAFEEETPTMDALVINLKDNL